MKMKAPNARAPQSPRPVFSALEEEDRFQEQIARRAYELWQEEGCPDGRETNFWLEAERQLLDSRKGHEATRPRI